MKGIGILFVVLNHCFARGSRKFLDIRVTDDPWMYGINRAIHFAVPLFLFISCALLARSLANSYDLKRYAKARWRKTVIPYLVASFAYSTLYLGAPWGDRWRLPRFLSELALGKASFHLYFTVVLIQVSVAIPILVALTRRRPWNFPLVAAIVVVSQVAVYELQRQVFRFTYPGSTILWYIAPLLIGMAVGLCKDSTVRLRAYVPWYLLGAAASLAGYIYVSILPLLGGPASSDMMNASYAAYSAFLSLLLWTLVPTWKWERGRRFFRSLGVVSLPLFLIHPAVMHFLGGPRATGVLASIPGGIVLYFLVTLGVSYLLAVGLYKTRIGQMILGQKMRRYGEEQSQPLSRSD